VHSGVGVKRVGGCRGEGGGARRQAERHLWESEARASTREIGHLLITAREEGQSGMGLRMRKGGRLGITGCGAASRGEVRKRRLRA
jgi:hypothetical protein